MGLGTCRLHGRIAHRRARGGGRRPPPGRSDGPPSRIKSQPVRRAEGYHQRFGLVHVDFDTQQRTPRASYAWYRELIAAHRAKPAAQ
ncbi:family 1 glycosylhydrolase [Streptomyces sp. TLI_053]|uniref:family 1 glycosylhydrolase n=1 Tax=Streptomyces sp. TLI_053 TaxID=1855352 RepID=UPI000B83CDC8|nr:family 1 glycosylhydrolase [Streptomyces sp. TLI_053]